jgi:hypothetical protein
MKLSFKTDSVILTFEVTEEIIKKMGAIYASSHFNDLDKNGEINCDVTFESIYAHLLIHTMICFAKGEEEEYIAGILELVPITDIINFKLYVREIIYPEFDKYLDDWILYKMKIDKEDPNNEKKVEKHILNSYDELIKRVGTNDQFYINRHLENIGKMQKLGLVSDFTIEELKPQVKSANKNDGHCNIL